MIKTLSFIFNSVVAKLVLAAYFYFLSSKYSLWADDFSIINNYEVKGFLGGVGDYYFGWMGNLAIVVYQYIAIYLVGEEKYFFELVNALFFVLLVWSIYVLAAKRVPKNAIDNSIFLLTGFLLLYLPASSGEVYFWHTGATGYLWSISIAAWLLTKMRSYNDRGMLPRVFIFLALILVALGSTQVAIMFSSISGFLLIGKYQKTQKITRWEWSTGAIYVSLFLVNVLSPGNRVRAAVLGVNKSLYDLSAQYFDRTINSLVGHFANINPQIVILFGLIFVIFLSVRVLREKYSSNKKSNESIVSVLVAFLGLFLFHQVATPWMVIEGRVAVAFELLIVFAIVYYICRLREDLSDVRQAMFIWGAVLGSFSFYVYFSTINLVYQLEYIRDVQVQRLAEIKASACIDGLIKTYPLRIPGVLDKVVDVYSKRLLFVSDITPNVSDWRNSNFRLYYGLNCRVIIE